jgi:hypothetical protein
VVLARQMRSNAETGQPDAAAFPVHQDIFRFDVLMDQASLVHLAERSGEPDRDSQEF